MAYFPLRSTGLGMSVVLVTALVASAGGCSNDVSDLFGGAGGTAAATTGGPSTTGSDATVTSSTTTSATNTSTTTVASSSTGAPPTCNNGTIEAPEQCDGDALGGITCVDGGFSKPDGASCDENCQISFKGCSATCGDGNEEPTEECDDNNTNSGDGCSSVCKDEVDPCTAPEPVALANGTMTIAGTTSGPSFHTSAGCNGQSAEVVYQVTPAESGYMTAWLTNAGTAFDAILYVRSSCNDQAELLCNDNEGGNNRGGDLLSLPVQAGVPVFLFVDGFMNQSGAFDLRLDLSSGEACDDPIPLTIELDGDVSVIGNTANHASNGVAEGCFGAGAAADLVYDVTFANGGGEHRVASTASFNSVLYARTACNDLTTEVACASPPADDNASITFDDEEVFVWIDGTSGEIGNYRLGFN